MSNEGEARHVVGLVAKALGVDLHTDPREGDPWSLRNMDRVVAAAHALATENADLRRRQATIIRKATSQHPNTLAMIASSFARRAD